MTMETLFLKAVLQKLNIPEESQVLVFVKDESPKSFDQSEKS